jgi:hypothetical protein
MKENREERLIEYGPILGKFIFKQRIYKHSHRLLESFLAGAIVAACGRNKLFVCNFAADNSSHHS